MAFVWQVTAGRPLAALPGAAPTATLLRAEGWDIADIGEVWSATPTATTGAHASCAECCSAARSFVTMLRGSITSSAHQGTNQSASVSASARFIEV